MEFEWDEAKRLINLDKHGLDFQDADQLFEGLHSIAPARSVGEELRWLITGWIDDRLVTAIFTRRSNMIRIISIRGARNEEKRRYKAVHLH